MEQRVTALSARRSRVAPDGVAQGFEAACAKLRAAVETATAAAPDDWPTRVAAAIRAVVEFATVDPAAAHLLTLDSLAQGSGAVARHGHPVDHLARLFAAGRDEHPDGEALPNLLEDALAGGIFMLLVQRLETGDTERLATLAPDAIEFALTPYVGRDRAREVAVARS